MRAARNEVEQSREHDASWHLGSSCSSTAEEENTPALTIPQVRWIVGKLVEDPDRAISEIVRIVCSVLKHNEDSRQQHWRARRLHAPLRAQCLYPWGRWRCR
jgi:hypothetical protein